MTTTRDRSQRESVGGEVALRRTLTLPWLVFYGVGITVGAGIFALIGEIIAESGVRAPLAFAVAGAVAAVTSLSYRDLVRRMPRAGGEAVWVSTAVGRNAGRIVGIALSTAGIVSSAVVALAFGGYVADVIDVAPIAAAIVVVVVLGRVAAFGARESIALGALITMVEVGTLLIVIAYGVPFLSGDALVDSVAVGAAANPADYLGPVAAGAVLAFFAFIGFEDIANMAEETVSPETTAPKAIAWTLVISISVYVLLALIAVSIEDPGRIAGSDAPMATLFEAVSGRGSSAIAAVAAVAMTNGILAQIMMSSRVVFGMGVEDTLGPMSSVVARVDRRRGTPAVATVGVVAAIVVLVAAVPLVHLARVTSLLVLGVFTMVNVAQVQIARTDEADRARRRHIARGAIGAVLCAALAATEIAALVT